MPKNIAFRNNLLVPYHVPLKFGLSANTTTLPVPTLEIIIERIKRASKGIKIIIATSNSYADNKIYLYCKKKKFLCFRGSLDDVFKRTIDCCKKYKLDYDYENVFNYRVNGLFYFSFGLS